MKEKKCDCRTDWMTESHGVRPSVSESVSHYIKWKRDIHSSIEA